MQLNAELALTKHLMKRKLSVALEVSVTDADAGPVVKCHQSSFPIAVTIYWFFAVAVLLLQM